MAAGTPVNNIAPLINKPFLVESYKNSTNSFGKTLVESKSLSIPITGVAKFFHLLNNAVTILFFPLPDFFYKLFPSQIMPRDTLFCQRALYHILSCYTSMICAWQPKNVISCHPFVSTNNVLKSIVESMAYMKRACYIGRRYHYRKCFL